jgi:DNA-binding transcriptional ArsR family regulator
MSHLQQLFPLDHSVFSGGRYLRAFDHLHDIDHYEHSILTYIGSLLPFDKGFLDHPAFPSIATISRSTKISESTVRKKLRSLEKNGYVKVKAVRFLNYQGKYQQSSNDYYLAPLAFEFFQDVMESRNHIQGIRKRVVGESFDGYSCPSAPDSPPFSQVAADHCPAETLPVPTALPNSLDYAPKENPHTSDSSSRDIFKMKGEVDRIAAAWEDLVRIPVSRSEKERFLKEYMRIRGNEIFYMERLLVIASDPYITSRAKSICFLFSGLDCALKNKAEIVEKAGLALMKAQTERELGQVLEEIPDFIKKKSRNFSGSSDEIVRHLLQDPINKARLRLGLKTDPGLPADGRQLRAEIQSLLTTNLSVPLKDQLKTILDALPRLSFGYCLEMFARFRSRLNAEAS